MLISHAKIIDPRSPHHLQVRDIRIDGGRIVEIGEALQPKEGEEHSTWTDCSVSPGWIDLMASAGDPGQEYREDIHSLLKAAEKGGFTGVGYMPATQPAIQTKSDIEYLIRKASDSKVKIFPLGSITRNREGVDLTEMYDMRHAGACAFTDADKPVKDAGIMLRALQYVKLFNGTIINVPSDHTIVGNASVNEGVMSTSLGMYGIPDVLEEIMVQRDILLASYAGSHVHIASVSSARSVERIRKAKSDGIRVTASVTPYHLYFDETAVEGYDTRFKVNPPLRTAEDVKALKEGFADGTIDTLTSFHMPWDVDAKECEFEFAEFGLAGIETVFAAANTALMGYADLSRLIEGLTYCPRQILGLPEVSIIEGAPAELTLFNESEAWTLQPDDIQTKGVNTVFTGVQLTGKVLGTII